MSNQKRADIIVTRQQCLHQLISEVKVRFEASVRGDRSLMRREWSPKTRDSMSITTGGKRNIDTRMGDESEGGRATLMGYGAV